MYYDINDYECIKCRGVGVSPDEIICIEWHRHNKKNEIREIKTKKIPKWCPLNKRDK